MPIIKTKSLIHEALVKQQQKDFEEMLSKTPKAQLPIVLHVQSLSPLSTISFHQKEWIDKVNSPSPRKPNDATPSPPTEKLPERGVCAGLVETWYDYLLQGKHLIDVLNSGHPTNPDLLRKVGKTQKSRANTAFLVPLSDKKDNSKISQNDDNDINKQNTFYDLNFSVMSALEFEEGSETLLATPDNLKKYLAQLHVNSSSEYGLHQISVLNTQTNRGHTFAWTRVADGYLLFDPNIGESYFKEYKNLMNYICDNHLLNLYDDRKQSLSVRDYYHADEVKELKFIQTSLRKNLKSSTDTIESHKINRTP